MKAYYCIGRVGSASVHDASDDVQELKVALRKLNACNQSF